MSGLLVSVVLPTYNEAPNIAGAVLRVRAALSGVPHEIIVADDDSPDLTWKLAEEAGARVIRRTKNRGLYPAVMDGFAAASGKYLAVLDADGQHDEAVLAKMVSLAESGAGLVIASRYCEGGGVGGWNRARLLISRAGNRLAALLLGSRASDIMSGFFLIDRELFLLISPKLKPAGFKILMDILGNLPEKMRVAEAGYVFRPRSAGESKLGIKVAWQAWTSLWSLSLGRYLSLAAAICLATLLAMLAMWLDWNRVASIAGWTVFLLAMLAAFLATWGKKS